MKDISLLIFPIILLAVTFFKVKPADTPSYDPLCLKQSRMIRGVACVWIVLHHLTQDITTYGMYEKGPVTLLNYCGILFTGIFFFFSGYGLITGLATKPGYLKGFLKKRLFSVLIPFWMVNALLVTLSILVSGIRYNIKDIFSDITGLTLINSNGWYIIEICMFYVLFYISFRLIKNKKGAAFVLSLAVIFVIRYAFFNGHDLPGNKSRWFRGEWWYNSTAVFILGLWYGLYRDRLKSFFHRHFTGALITVSALFLVTFTASIKAVNILGYYRSVPYFGSHADPFITFILQSLSCLLFAGLVLLINSKLKLDNPIIIFLGSISTELFLIHGFFINSVFDHTGNRDFLFFALVLICSIPAAWILSACTGKIRKLLIPEKNGIINAETEPDLKTDQEPARKEGPDRDGKAFPGRITKTKHLIPLVFIILIILLLLRNLFIFMEYKSEISALEKADIGDVVRYGRFDTDGIGLTKERLSWIVLDNTQNSLLLICEKGISGSSYNRKSEEISWSESDLRGLINSKKYTGMFSAHELKNVQEYDGDIISLLTVDEAAKYFDSDMKRQLDITPAAEAAGTNINRMTKTNNWDMKNYRSAWWWLKKSSDDKAITAPIVTADGEIRPDEKYVNKPYGAVRPVIRVRITPQP